MSKKRLGINHFIEIFTPNLAIPKNRKSGELACDHSICGVADVRLRKGYCRMHTQCWVLLCLTHKNRFNILTR